MGYAIGIDIGTANTRVAVFRDGQVEIIPDKDGQRCMPSYVAFTERCRLFGNAAMDHANYDPKNTVYGVKRVLGQRLEQWNVDRHARISPNDVSLEPPGRMPITVGYKKRPRRLLPVQVFAMLLRQAAANAVTYLGESVQDVVISVPARFDRLQRLDVTDAAKLAGLNLMHMGSAIESVALYYAFLNPQLTTRLDGEQVCTILDLGAGSFNAGLVSIKNGAIKLMSAQSDPDLGGECLIDRLQDHFAAEIKRKWNWNINTDLLARRRLRVACEAAMRELSSTVSARILIGRLYDGQDFSGNLSREMLEELCQDLFHGTLKTIDRVFNNRTLHETTGLDKSSITEAQNRPNAKKGRERPVSKFGLIIKPSNKNRRVKSTIKDRQNKSSIIDTVEKLHVNDIVMVGGCSRIPKLQQIWTTHLNCIDDETCGKLVSPDEFEVHGCAVHAGILSGIFLYPALSVSPVVPLNIGLKVEGGIMSTVVPRNTILPTTQKKTYCLSDFALVPHERPILHFYQGNKKKVKDNLLICTLDLSEFPPRWKDDRSKTNIQIIFEIDLMQRVVASAVLGGKETRYEAWQMVKHRSKEEMDSLMVQAVAYEEEDVTYAEELLASQRRSQCHALDLRLSSMGQFESLTFQTKGMMSLLHSLRLWRNWLDKLRPGDPFDYHAYNRRLDDLEQDLKGEMLRGNEISRLRSHAEHLQKKLLATNQEFDNKAMLQSVDSVTQWVEQNEGADIVAIREKLSSLRDLSESVELAALSERPDEIPPSRESTPSVKTAQDPGTGVQAQTQGPRGFNELFPESGWDTTSKYTDAEFEDIASYLRNTGHETWSKVPRIYTVLRLIDKVELVDTFLKHGMADIMFPFSLTNLPKALKQPHANQFLNTQVAVYSKALQLERGARLDDQKLYRKHAHFSHSEPLPFEVKGNLGSGAHGSIVDKVVSTLSYREYARKRFKRPALKKKDVEKFLNELGILKRLKNRHCIDLVGSYSDPRYFALIMHPVAECNLEKYLSSALNDPDKRSILQGFFGCLASTLDYLHSQKVVHQDIKPQNILVKNNSHVLVTDFGIARSWEGLTGATTTADLARTWAYAAPEVVRGGPKNQSADMWSLGCVFLEMFTVLNGQSPTDMRDFFRDRSGRTHFYENAAPGHIAAWVESLRERSSPELNGALDWLDSMLQVEPRYRCKPFELFDKTVAATESTSVLFCGACCRDSGESAPESNDDDTDGWSEGDDEDI